VPPAPCRRLADNTQLRFTACRVGGANRVAVHLRAIKRRQIGIGHDIFSQNTPQGVCERDPFNGQPLGLLFDNANGLCD
jgi:hypothetical protein